MLRAIVGVAQANANLENGGESAWLIAEDGSLREEGGESVEADETARADIAQVKPAAHLQPAAPAQSEWSLRIVTKKSH